MSVVMIFPPLVSSGFGSYYPALPVLTSYLAANGHSVAQIDLNEELAVYLLNPERLSLCGAGEFYSGEDGRRDTCEMPAVAARLLLQNRNQLFSLEGRHRFSDRNASPAYLLSVLAQTYVVDRSVSQTIKAITEGETITQWYMDFYESQNLEQSLPNDCTLVGLSVAMGPQLFPALILAQQIRRLRPDIRIVLGGPTMSLMQEPAIELIFEHCIGVDAVVRYEGELPLLELAEQAENGMWMPSAVPATSSARDGEVVHRAPAPGVPLDSLPFAEYEPTLLKKLEDPEFGVVQTRGCYWGRCAYCDFVELYDGSPRYRGRSPESFVDEVEYLANHHGARRFSLITEAIPPSFSLKFSRLVIERGLDISWSSFAMVDRHFKSQHFDAMAQSGCDHLVIGLETMTDRVLEHVHKYASGDDNERFLRAASEAGISLLINLIPDLPTTTHAEALESLERLEGLEDCLAGVAVFPFEATRSSQIGRNPERYGIAGIADSGLSGQAVFADNHLQIDDPGMTPVERADIQKRYSDFADYINAKKAVGTLEGDAVPLQSERFTIAHDDLDTVTSGGAIQFFNWRSRERWEAPSALLRILERAEAQGPTFTRKDILRGATMPVELGFLVDTLIEKKIFVPVGNSK